MSRMLLKGPALGLAATLAVAAPAGATGWDHHEKRHADGKAPARVVQKSKAALKAIDRAGERLDDNETAKAVSQLAAARRHLASAQRTAVRKLGGEQGPAAAAKLFGAQGRAAHHLAGMFDEQNGEAVTALAQTLGFVVDRRDALVAAIVALDDGTEARYAGLMGAVAGALDKEIESYDDALTDDTLTEAARTAITDAKTKATATKAALQARVAALTAPSTTGSGEWGGDKPCRDGRGERSRWDDGRHEREDDHDDRDRWS